MRALTRASLAAVARAAAATERAPGGGWRFAARHGGCGVAVAAAAVSPPPGVASVRLTAELLARVSRVVQFRWP
jgi:hypothetical protein